MLVYPDVRAAVAWLTEAFGFTERVAIGESHRAQLGVGTDGAVIVADVGGSRRPPEAGAVTCAVRVRVDDVAAVHDRALVAGATVLEPPTDREYGERECTVADPAGHQWLFSQTLRDVAPEEFGCRTVQPWWSRPEG